MVHRQSNDLTRQHIYVVTLCLGVFYEVGIRCGTPEKPRFSCPQDARTGGRAYLTPDQLPCRHSVSYRVLTFPFPPPLPLSKWCKNFRLNKTDVELEFFLEFLISKLSQLSNIEYARVLEEFRGNGKFLGRKNQKLLLTGLVSFLPLGHILT